MLQNTKKRKRRPDASYAFKLHCLVKLKKGRAAVESVCAIAKRLGVPDRRLRPSGWVAEEAKIRVADIGKHNRTRTGLKHRRLPGGGKKCKWPKLEEALKLWLDNQKKQGKKVAVGGFWKEVDMQRNKMPELKDAPLGFEWWQAVKRRLGIRFSAPSRTAVLGVDVIKAKISKMITWHRAACNFHKPTVIITFDEAPVSFNAGYVQKMVLYEGEQPV